MTRAEQKMLAFVAKFHGERGYGPTFREIGVAMGFASTNGVRYWLDALVSGGHIKRDPHVSRSIQPVSAGGAQHGARQKLSSGASSSGTIR